MGGKYDEASIQSFTHKKTRHLLCPILFEKNANMMANKYQDIAVPKSQIYVLGSVETVYPFMGCTFYSHNMIYLTSQISSPQVENRSGSPLPSSITQPTAAVRAASTSSARGTGSLSAWFCVTLCDTRSSWEMVFEVTYDFTSIFNQM